MANKKYLHFIQRLKLSKKYESVADADIYMMKLRMYTLKNISSSFHWKVLCEAKTCSSMESLQKHLLGAFIFKSVM